MKYKWAQDIRKPKSIKIQPWPYGLFRSTFNKVMTDKWKNDELNTTNTLIQQHPDWLIHRYISLYNYILSNKSNSQKLNSLVVSAGSSPVGDSVQRWALCSNGAANVWVSEAGGSSCNL